MHKIQNKRLISTRKRVVFLLNGKTFPTLKTYQLLFLQLAMVGQQA